MPPAVSLTLPFGLAMRLPTCVVSDSLPVPLLCAVPTAGFQTVPALPVVWRVESVSVLLLVSALWIVRLRTALTVMSLSATSVESVTVVSRPLWMSMLPADWALPTTWVPVWVLSSVPCLRVSRLTPAGSDCRWPASR